MPLASPHPIPKATTAMQNRRYAGWYTQPDTHTHTQAQPHTLLNVNEEKEQHQQIFRYFLVCREMFPQ